MTDTMTSDNYDETADIVFGGDISLDIGAANYDAAMRATPKVLRELKLL